MPFQSSTAGFILATMAAVLLGSGPAACGWAEDCCSDRWVSSCESLFSSIPRPADCSPPNLLEPGSCSCHECSDRLDQDTVVPEAFKSKLPYQRALPQTSDDELAQMQLSYRSSHPEVSRLHHIAGDSLVIFKCSLLS
jgi:hypothetical protein